MLFNSYAFLFGYLPLVLIGYQIAAYWHRRAVVIWLAIASLGFYAYWHPIYLLLLVSSVVFNYAAGWVIAYLVKRERPATLVLWFAIAGNLALLCYFKYLYPLFNFFSGVTHSAHHWQNVVLPLGISFFTFTQIAYLVDLEQGAAKQQDLDSYCLFVTFFPHLIAGPILHHAEIMPQFQSHRDYRLRADDLAIGFSWFVMGMVKKVLLADNFAKAADGAFAAPAALHPMGAWAGVLSYALQLYFDFSGYSDMALGLARMFSIDFPLNFSSPYKAASIIDFWQRWHMTLTRYIMAYIYNPASIWINRRRVAQGKKITRKATRTIGGYLELVAFPTILTLFLAGIWHGAGLQFIIFGLLHGTYLCINHAWRIFRTPARDAAPQSALSQYVSQAAGVLLTFSAVLVAQVFFRASGVGAAVSILRTMVGFHHLPPGVALGYRPSMSLLPLMALGYFIVWTMPNTQQILARFKPALEISPSDRKASVFKVLWEPSAIWALALGVIFFVALVRMQDPSTFLYFQF